MKIIHTKSAQMNKYELPDDVFYNNKSESTEINQTFGKDIKKLESAGYFRIGTGYYFKEVPEESPNAIKLSNGKSVSAIWLEVNAGVIIVRYGKERSLIAYTRDSDEALAAVEKEKNSLTGVKTAKKKSKEWDPNPWAVCSKNIDKKKNPAKHERCVQDVKKKQKKTKKAQYTPATEDAYVAEQERLDGQKQQIKNDIGLPSPVVFKGKKVKPGTRRNLPGLSDLFQPRPFITDEERKKIKEKDRLQTEDTARELEWQRRLQKAVGKDRPQLMSSTYFELVKTAKRKEIGDVELDIGNENWWLSFNREDLLMIGDQDLQTVFSNAVLSIWNPSTDEKIENGSDAYKRLASIPGVDFQWIIDDIWGEEQEIEQQEKIDKSEFEQGTYDDQSLGNYEIGGDEEPQQF